MSYPTSGPTAIRPHAPTAITGTNYTYNPNGSRTATSGAVAATLTWNKLNQLSSHTAGTTVTKFFYGPSGERASRTVGTTSTVNERTVYLPGLEITKTGTNPRKITRYYTSGRATIAFRVDGTLHWLTGDHQGSATLDIPNGTTTPATVIRQNYRPYGTKRGTDTVTATDRGYIGQTEDTTTTLNYLNNRYLEASTGVFLSVDPMVSSTGDPYLYASGNPTTLSDPSGLEPCSWCSSVETRHHGQSQAELKNALEQARQTCALACGNDPEGYGSVAADDLDFLPGRIKTAPAYNLDWARCMAGGGLESCGTPELVVDGPSGVVGKGTHSLHQAWWCATRGAFACGGVFANARHAESQAAVWLSSGEYTENETNAMMHAMWFALNRSAASTLELGESDVRALGIAHESDWRDSYVDSARDLMNNEVGIGIGRTTSVGDVPAAIVAALRSGQLSCLTSNGEGIVTCRSG